VSSLTQVPTARAVHRRSANTRRGLTVGQPHRSSWLHRRTPPCHQGHVRSSVEGSSSHAILIGAVGLACAECLCPRYLKVSIEIETGVGAAISDREEFTTWVISWPTPQLTYYIYPPSKFRQARTCLLPDLRGQNSCSRKGYPSRNANTAPFFNQGRILASAGCYWSMFGL
jgi:hypothetical protein